MKLSSISIQGNQGYIEGTGKENEVISEGLKNGMKEISGKTPGQTVSGEVVAKNGNDLLISIGKDQLLHAKLDSSVLVEQGSQMTFAIKALTGSKVVLSPLFTNTATDPNVSKALQMAGIPETETSVKMVQTMMQEGMSIDKNSLQQMMRSVNLNPGANMDTLVQLERLQIPITEDSIFQMEAYKNYEHQMTESLLSIADALTETVQGMAAEGNMAEGITLYKEIFALLTEQAKELTGGADGKMQMPVDEDGNPVLDVKNGMNEEQSLQNMKSEAELMPKSGEQLSDAGKSILSGQEKEALGSQLKQAGVE